MDGAGGVGGLLSMTHNVGGVTNTYFYAYDGNGNVRVLVKADAANPTASAIVERYAYDGFGRELAGSTTSATSVNGFRFSTKQLDRESGTNYYGYRYYASADGRWINRDPILEKGGWNLYAMVGNDAILFIDSNGLIKIPGTPIDVGPMPTAPGPFVPNPSDPFPNPQDPNRPPPNPFPPNPTPGGEPPTTFGPTGTIPWPPEKPEKSHYSPDDLKRRVCEARTNAAKAKCGPCEQFVATMSTLSESRQEIECGGVCQKK